MAHGGQDMFLDILTKEEKEDLLNKKMEEIRRKNAERQRRHEEIEADRRLAEKHASAVNLKVSSTTVAGSKREVMDGKQSQPRKMQGVQESNADEHRKPSKFSKGRGTRLAHMSKEALKAQEYEGRQAGPHPKSGGRPRSAEVKSPKSPPPTDGPPPDPVFNFLADRSREGPMPEQGPRESARRHPRNFGGASFNNVKNKIKQEKQGRHSGGPPRSKMDLSLQMTGKERRDYLQWRAEREKIDQERIDRQRNAEGDWKREWDYDKTEDDFDEPPPAPPSPRLIEPGRRPAGRIGSGRFDRGERDERPKAAGRGGHEGRGESRGRGGARGLDRIPPRHRLSSGGSDDRSVEEQNDHLVIKIENEFAADKRSHRGGRSQRGGRGGGGESFSRGGGGEEDFPPLRAGRGDSASARGGRGERGGRGGGGRGGGGGGRGGGGESRRPPRSGPSRGGGSSRGGPSNRGGGGGGERYQHRPPPLSVGAKDISSSKINPEAPEFHPERSGAGDYKHAESKSDRESRTDRESPYRLYYDDQGQGQADDVGEDEEDWQDAPESAEFYDVKTNETKKSSKKKKVPTATLR